MDRKQIVTPAKLEFVPLSDGVKVWEPFSQFPKTIEEYGYKKEDWFASGEADGKPYRAYVDVYYPTDPKKFSGVIIAEPMHYNPIVAIFSNMGDYILRSGHAWACIGSAKSTQEKFIKPTGPRYDSLHIDSEPLSERAAALDLSVPPSFPDEEGDYWWDQLAIQNYYDNDILAQVGAALKASTGPLEGYEAKKIILAGHSYTGMITSNYINKAHDRLRLADGSPVFDGFFPSGYPMQAFHNCDVPIVQTITQGDICSANELPYRVGYDMLSYRREDSDEPGDRYRLYEFPGSSHTTMQYPPINDLKFLEMMDPTLHVPEKGNTSNYPFCEMHQMALHHLVEWVANGVVPPKAQRMTVNENPEDPHVFARDEHGNVLGGVRCALLDVPMAIYTPNKVNDNGTTRFGSYGIMIPFDHDKLSALYGTKENYMALLSKRLEELIAENWFLPEDTEWLMDDLSKREF